MIEPGTRLAGRYRLEERVSEAGGSTLWKAIDEILARPVAVRTFDPDVPNAHEVVTAARAASRLTDPRLTQVFDADDGGESAYVVSEWASGETLEAMLADRGPLEPGRAATLLHEAAEAIAAAHAAGLAHLRLTPRDLLWTTGGTVKLLGIAVDAVLAESDLADPAGEDARGIGRMLYAAVTAHWPGDPEQSALPPAPTTDDGEPCPPRQLRAGVPQALDALVRRALGVQIPEGQEPLASPAELAKALAGVPRTPLPLFTGLTGSPPPAVLPRQGRPQPHAPQRSQPPAPPAPPQRQPRPSQDQTQQYRQGPGGGPGRRAVHRPGSHQQPPAPVPAPAPPRARHAAGPPQQQGPAVPPPGSTAPVSHRAGSPGGRFSRPLIAVAAAAVTVIVGVSAWQLGKDDASNDGSGKPPADRDASPSSPASRELNVASAAGFDPTRPDHPDSSVPKGASAAIDQSPKTDWHSQSYSSAQFGNLKEGLGLILDMGRPVKVSRVKLITPGGPGAVINLRVGSARDLSALGTVGRTTTTGGSAEITATGDKRGQYVLLWFTRLPQSLKASISQVTVYGTP